MNSAKFRKQLIKIMPGYTWTVHRALARGMYLNGDRHTIIWFQSALHAVRDAG